MCVYAYTKCICIRVYAYACPCARVSAVSGPFFGGRGPSAPSQILSLRVYNMPTVSTISRPRLHVCTVSTDYTRVNVSMHSVYKLCTVSTNYAQCLQTMHSVYKLCTVSTNYAQCLQTMHRVYMYAQCLRTIRIRVYEVYTYMRTRAHIYTYISD